MSDPERPTGIAAVLVPDPAVEGVLKAQIVDRSVALTSERSETLPLLEETATVSKRHRVTGSVKVETRTELRQESAEVALERHVVDVTRVPINRLIEETPEIRTEGDTTIIPVVEERFVVVKQFLLKEEVHIRHRTERETVRETVKLRRQHAVVRRTAPDGGITEPDEPLTPATSTAEP